MVNERLAKIKSRRLHHKTTYCTECSIATNNQIARYLLHAINFFTDFIPIEFMNDNQTNNNKMNKLKKKTCSNEKVLGKKETNFMLTHSWNVN